MFQYNLDYRVSSQLPELQSDRRIKSRANSIIFHKLPDK